jgi:sugar (pentulose or hexulose) kinase
MEGEALALADGHDALLASGARIGDVTLAGGGARSTLWARLVALRSAFRCGSRLMHKPAQRWAPHGSPGKASADR